MKKKYFILLLILCTSLSSWAAESVFDPYFGKDGQVLQSIVDNKEDHGEVVAVDEKGFVTVAGMAGINDQLDFFVLRLKPDGKLDQSFGKEGVVIFDLGGQDHVHGLVVSPKGVVYVAGYVKKGDRADFAVLSLNPNGSLNESFGRKGVSLTDLSGWAEGHYAALMADGALLVAGFVEKKNDSDWVLVKYLPDGNTDASFGDGGRVVLDWTKKDRLYGLSLSNKTRQQKIVVTGSALQAGRGEDCIVAQFNADGSRNKDFGFGGLTPVSFGQHQDVCAAVDVTKTGKIIVAGYKNNEGVASNFAVARLTAIGEMDTSFGDNGFKIIDFDGGMDAAHAVSELPGGDLLVFGESEISTPKGTQKRFSAMRLDNKGQVVTTWGEKGKLDVVFGPEKPEVGLGMAQDKKGDVYLVGYAQENAALLKVLTTPQKKKKR